MDGLPPPTPVTAQCMWDAAVKERLPIEILVAVLYVERGKPGLRKRNSNGSEDLGPFQINSVHTSDPVTRHWLANDGCYGAAAAAYRLRVEIDRAGDTWRGTGNFHSRSPLHHQRYLRLIVSAIRETSDYSRQMRQIFAPQASAANESSSSSR